MSENKKFYWLKLQKDFFKRHDIKIIKSMPNGKEYIIFYLTLLLESISHDGNLRFSETIPYNEEMLSVITDTNIDIVRSAMAILTELKMIEVLEDSTIYMSEVNKMMGCETSVANRVRNHREKQKMLQCNTDVTNCNKNVTQSKSKSKSKSIELDIKESSRFTPPTLEEVTNYITDKILTVNANDFYTYFTEGDWIDSNGKKVKNWKQKLLTWNNQEKNKSKKQRNKDTSYDISKNFKDMRDIVYGDSNDNNTE